MWHKTRRNKKKNKSIKQKRFVEQSDFKSFHLIFDLLRFITWSSHKLAGRIVADNSTWKSAETSCETSIIYRPSWDEISRKSSGRKWPIQSENGGGKAQFIYPVSTLFHNARKWNSFKCNSFLATTTTTTTTTRGENWALGCLLVCGIDAQSSADSRGLTPFKLSQCRLYMQHTASKRSLSLIRIRALINSTFGGSAAHY